MSNKSNKFKKFNKFSLFSKLNKFRKFSKFNKFSKLNKLSKLNKFSKLNKLGKFSKFSKWSWDGAVGRYSLSNNRNNIVWLFGVDFHDYKRKQPKYSLQYAISVVFILSNLNHSLGGVHN